MPSKQGFLGLENKDLDLYANADVVVIPFGLESTVSYGGGTSKGPKAIIDASHEVELFDEQLWCEPCNTINIVTLEPPKIISEPEKAVTTHAPSSPGLTGGSKSKIKNQNTGFPVFTGNDGEQLQKALKQLEDLVGKVLRDGKFPVVLGGEHSITAGAIRPYLENYKNLVILHFDAHADLRDSYQGEHYSHASAIRRCLDNPNVNLISVGIRNISAEELPFLDKNQQRINIFWAKDKKSWNLQELAALLKDRPIYVTFDVDAFDSSLMPATGTPEPGGLFWDEAIEIMTLASQAGTFVGADITELSPIPNFHACEFLVAKLVYKIIALSFQN